LSNRKRLSIFALPFFELVRSAGIRREGINIFLKKIKKYLVSEKRICNFAPPKRRNKKKRRKKGTRS
jgi:hypothetical protein